MTFNVGDKVRVREDARFAHSRLRGLGGTVMLVDGLFIAVQFEEYIPDILHDCSGHCVDGYGWWVEAGDLDLVEAANDPLELAWSDLVDQADEGQEPTSSEREFFVAGWHAAIRHMKK